MVDATAMATDPLISAFAAIRATGSDGRPTAAALAARESFILANVPLAVRLATLFAHSRHRPMTGDVRSEAIAGLILAVDRFDPARGVRFSTYANHWIFQRVRDHLTPRRPRVGGCNDWDFAGTPDPATEGGSDSAAAAAGELHAWVAHLPEPDRTVITLRYGLGDGPPRLCREVAPEIGKSKARVHQIEVRALGRLREIAGVGGEDRRG